jgi:hypothetical protein
LVSPRPWYIRDSRSIDALCRAQRWRIRRAKLDQRDTPFGLILIPLICVVLACLA